MALRVVEERLPFERQRRDVDLLDRRFRRLKWPRGMVDFGAQSTVTAVEAVALGEEVLECAGFCRGRIPPAAISGAELSVLADAASVEDLTPGVDLREPVWQPIGASRGFNGGSAGSVETEKPDSGSITRVVRRCGN